MTSSQRPADTVEVDELTCANCGGTLDVRVYSFDLDLAPVALCLFCLWGPDGIFSPRAPFSPRTPR